MRWATPPTTARGKTVPNDNSTKILVVEDQEITRTGLKLVLGRISDFVVVGEAADGQSAVHKAMELRPTVVLMDLGLPIIDGIEATKQIKSKLPNTRVLVLTTRDSDSEVLAAFAAGADGYCLKETPGPRIATAIKAIAAGGVWLHPAIANRLLQVISKVSAAGEDKIDNTTDTPRLTELELQVISLIVDGLSVDESAQRLRVSPETIQTVLRHITQKLMVSDLTQAAVAALRQGRA
jgi:NarL family two-component system response regulator LiaR